ncbi:hypothetical protein N7447_008795 [Penicillium robsamsonii]|uniref:uncharacterized protein n=1 Tax=Penicillium robsamsonii TaxID=1792511 RepID=UPI002548A934|nr:uncharacterized protein N7447_008795 [Penicillium robsamsonii]KAJ5816562.1 hypothetical protein N7447_008795 [Penicillium robsamsonii]
MSWFSGVLGGHDLIWRTLITNPSHAAFVSLASNTSQIHLARSLAMSTTEVPLVPPYHFGKSIVPPDWTTCPGSPSFEYEWDGVDSAGQKIARGYGLTPGRPILDNNDASTIIFQSGDKLYIWDVLYHDVYEIASQDINEVARVLSQEGGYKKLHKRLLDPVEDIAV